jgi:CHAD domain-containing protein
MAFRFRLGEPFDEGFRRIALEQIDRAQSQLAQADDQSVAIHESRKALKRVRALLRLMRPAIGDEIFRRENSDLRDIGLSLSGARDRHVLLETAMKLDAMGRFERRSVADNLRQTILGAGTESEPVRMKAAAERLAGVRDRLSTVTATGSGFAIVGEGLEKSYRTARRAFRHAYAEPSDEAFHEWRKGAQRHWRQMSLLSRAWPELLEARVGEARALSQLLGDDHDLAVLVAFVHSEAAASLRKETAAIVETAARGRQEELRAAAHPRGDRLFATGARQLRKNIGEYWEAAARLKQLERDESPTKPKRIRRPAVPPKGRRRPHAASKA